MEPKEKWQRLNNPTCAADYGLSLNEDELRTFKRGRALLCVIIKQRKKAKRLEIIAEKILNQLWKHREQMIYDMLITGE